MNEQQNLQLQKIAAVLNAAGAERPVDEDSTVLPTANYRSPMIRHLNAGAGDGLVGARDLLRRR